MNVIKSLTLLSFVGFIALWIFVGFSFALLLSFIVIWIAAIFLSPKPKAPKNGQKNNETNEEYEQRKKTEEFQHQIAKNNDYANNRDFQLLITVCGVPNTLKIFKTLHDQKIWTDKSPNVVYQTIQPLVQQCGKDKAAEIVFALLDKGFWRAENPFFVSNTLLPLIQTCGGWDIAGDILQTLCERKILTPTNGNDLINGSVIPLLKVCGAWEKTKEILFSPHEQGLLIQHTNFVKNVVLPLMQACGDWDTVKDILQTLHEKGILTTTNSYALINSTVAPLLKVCGSWEKTKEILFSPHGQGSLIQNLNFVKEIIVPLMQACRDWDTVKDILQTLHEKEILTTTNSYDLINSAVIPLLKVCGSWGKAKEILWNLHRKGLLTQNANFVREVVVPLFKTLGKWSKIEEILLTYHENGVLQHHDFSLVKAVIPLIQIHGWKKVKEISLPLFQIKVWTQQQPNFLSDVVFPLLETEKTENVFIALTALKKSNIKIDRGIVSKVRSYGLKTVTSVVVTLAEERISKDLHFAYNTVLPMTCNFGWDDTRDILITLRNVGFDPITHTKFLENTLPNLIESYGWKRIKESIKSLESEEFSINEHSFEEINELLTRYEPKQLGYALTHIKEGTLFVGAHKIEVKTIMGEPDYVKSGGRTEDWCYEPSKNAKKFGKRIKFRGDYVYDFRI